MKNRLKLKDQYCSLLLDLIKEVNQDMSYLIFYYFKNKLK